MTRIYVLGLLMIASSAVASNVIPNAEVVAKLMSSPEVQKELMGKSITDIKVSQSNLSTTWTYTLKITSLEVGLGPDGVSSHPCYTKVTQDIVGGVAGNSTMKPQVETICAMNSPRF